jgi:WD40-like Beta Propeller Repeat
MWHRQATVTLRRMLRTRPVLLPLAAGALVALPAAAAHAAAPGSAIVYVAGGDIWQVSPDGTGTHALTTDGTTDAPYQRPRLAPDGSVFALRGFDVVHVSAAGQRIGAFTPRRPKDSDGVAADQPPGFLDLSPDGTKLAYGIENLRCEDDGSCNQDGITAILDAATGNTLSEQVGISEAAFAGDDRIIGNEGVLGVTGRSSSLIGPPAQWYRDADISDRPGMVREPAIATDLQHYAALKTMTGVGVAVFTYKVPAGLGQPVQQCVVNNARTSHASPTWSPDGRRLALAQNDGLAVYDLSAVGQPSECATRSTAIGVADAGASDPDWGALAVAGDGGGGGGGDGTPGGGQTTTATPPATTPGGGTTTAKGVTTPAGKVIARATGRAAAKLTVAPLRLGALLRGGLKVRLTGLPAGKAKVVVKAKGKVLGSAAVKVPASGSAAVTVKLSPAGRRALRGAHKTTLTVIAGTVSRTLTVKR